MVDRRQFGNYLLLDVIGSGGFGLVYAANDLKSGEKVAIKILPEDYSKLHGGYSERELALRQRVHHPNIANVRETGLLDGRMYVVADYVEGIDSATILDRQGRFPPEEAIEYALDIADALSALHGEGILHRDVKPSNIVITPQRKAVLIDFGLAISTAASSVESPAPGTLRYMAPEVLSGENSATPSSDVYSLGCVLFEYLSGAPAFAGGSSAEALNKKFFEQPPRLPQALRREYPTLGDAVNEALSPILEARLATAREFTAIVQAARYDSRLQVPRPVRGNRISRGSRITGAGAPAAVGFGVPSASTILPYRAIGRARVRNRSNINFRPIPIEHSMPAVLAAILLFTAMSLAGLSIAAALPLSLVPILVVLVTIAVDGPTKRYSGAIAPALAAMATRASSDYRRMHVSLGPDFRSRSGKDTFQPDSTRWP